jgi:hypothetical protein
VPHDSRSFIKGRLINLQDSINLLSILLDSFGLARTYVIMIGQQQVSHDVET